MGRAIGIDLGTSFCVAAVIENKIPLVIPNREGNNLTPSVFALTDKNEYLVGNAAKEYATKNQNLVHQIIQAQFCFYLESVHAFL